MTTNTTFGDLRALCQSMRATEDLIKIAALLKEAYAQDPEQTCDEHLPYALETLHQKPRIKPAKDYDQTMGPLLARATLDELLQVSDEVLWYGCRIQREQSSNGATYYPLYPRMNDQQQLPESALLPTRNPEKDRYVDRKNTCLESLRMNAAMRLLRDKQRGQLDERVAWLQKQRKSKRWRPIIDAVESSLQMRSDASNVSLEIHDGLWPDELDFIEQQIGKSLPEIARTFYQLIGRTFVLNKGGNHPICPYDWTPHRAMQLIMDESQGEFGFYIWLGGKAKNPKVYTSCEYFDHDPSPELVRARVTHDPYDYPFTGHRFATFWTQY